MPTRCRCSIRVAERQTAHAYAAVYLASDEFAFLPAPGIDADGGRIRVAVIAI